MERIGVASWKELDLGPKVLSPALSPGLRVRFYETRGRFIPLVLHEAEKADTGEFTAQTEKVY